MKYTIQPGIAAIVTVYADCFPVAYGEKATSFIYMAEGKPIEKGIGNSVELADLPLPVQAAINKHFGAVFSLPVSGRGEYLASFKDCPIVITEGE